MLPVRIGIVLCACVAMAFGVSRLRENHRCEDARSTITAALFHHRLPAGGLDAQQRSLVAHCRSRTTLAFVSALETTAGLHGPALALARRVTRDEPRNRVGWIALAQALERSDPQGAEAARARAREVDPIGRVPPAAGRGAAQPGP